MKGCAEGEVLGSHESSAGLEAIAQGQAREAEAGAGNLRFIFFPFQYRTMA